MAAKSKPTCRIVKPHHTFGGKQGLNYLEGIAAETVGSTGICMHILTIPPGACAKAHLHEAHETAIYVLSARRIPGTAIDWRSMSSCMPGSFSTFRPAFRICRPISAVRLAPRSLPAATRTSRKALYCCRNWMHWCRLKPTASRFSEVKCQDTARIWSIAASNFFAIFFDAFSFG